MQFIKLMLSPNWAAGKNVEYIYNIYTQDSIDIPADKFPLNRY